MAKEVVVRIRAELDGFKNDLNEAGKIGVELGQNLTESIDKANATIKKAGSNYKEAFASSEVNNAVKANAAAINQLADNVDDLNSSQVKLIKNTKELTDQYDENKSATAQASAQIDKLTQSQNELAAQNKKNTKEFKTLSGQLRALKNEISLLEQAGQEGSAAFIKLATQAARLEDQIGDTRERIKVLASDTFAFDALVDGTQSVVAGFQIAEGAAALFGVENEKLQETMVRLNALLNIQNGLQQVATFVTGQSAAKLALLSAAQKVNAVATNLTSAAYRGLGLTVTASSTAFKVLRGAIISTGIGALIVGVGLLVQKFIEFQESAQKSSAELERYKAAIKGADDAIQTFKDAQRDASDRIALATKKVTREQLDQRDAIAEQGKAFTQAAAPILREQQRIQESISESNNRIAAQRNALEAAKQSGAESAPLRIASATEALNSELEANAQLNAQAAATEAKLTNLKTQYRGTIVKVTEAFAAEEKANKKNNKAKKETQKIDEVLIGLQNQLAQAKIRQLEATPGTDAALQASLDVIEAEELIAARQTQNEIEKTLIFKKGETDRAAFRDEFDRKRKEAALNTQIELARIAQLGAEEGTKAELDATNKLVQLNADKLKLQAETQEERIRIQKEADKEIEANTKAFYEKEAELARNARVAQLENEIANTKEFSKERLKKQNELIRFNAEELAATKKTAEEKKKILDDAEREITKNTQEFSKQRTQFIIDSFNQVSGAIFDIVNSSLQKQITNEEKSREFLLKNTELTEEQKAAIIADSDNKIREIKRKQAINDKAAALFSIFLNTAKAVTENLKNPALAIAAGIAGAAQAAAVAARPIPEFRHGGFVEGASHEAGGTIIEAERNEFVVRASRAPHHRTELEAMNRSREAYLAMIRERYVKPEIVSFANEVRRSDSVKVKATLNSQSLESEMRQTRKATIKGLNNLSAKFNQRSNPRNYW